jgi:UDP-glucuronate decarboxylase
MQAPDTVTGPINIGNPTELQVIDLARQVLSLTGSASTLAFVSLPSDDPKQRRPNISYAKQILGWAPKISLEEGLKATIAHFKSVMSLTA